VTPRLISLMVFLPLVGAIIQSFLPSSGTKGKLSVSKWAALGASMASTLAGLVLVFSLKAETAEAQITEILPWIGSYAISYEMSVDGLNALLVLLVSIIFPLLIASEWDRKDGIKGVHGLFLLLQSSFLGAVCAQDLFLLFFFWALSMLPFYFLIGIWGGAHREAAAFRSIVAAALGNVLLFAALILIYYSVDPHTFSIKMLAGGKLEDKTFMFLGRDLSVAAIAFGLISSGLALRAPIWPFHGWFTDAAEEAPPSVFVALSAVSVPVATYLFIRFAYSLFPQTINQVAIGVVTVGAINLLIGGICALAQRDLRLLAAFVCLGEVGLIMIGIGSLNSVGVVGAVYQQLALGLGLAGFGLMTGVFDDRSGSTAFADEKGESMFGGVAAKAPAIALVAGIVIASILGFPGLGGFVGHSMLMIGSYSVHPGAVILAGTAILLATYYLFTMYRHLFLGKQSEVTQVFADLSIRERAYLFPLVAALLVFGLYPKPLIDLVKPAVTGLLSTIK
jgi:NADH-quinone oxidoreductase subunit M